MNAFRRGIRNAFRNMTRSLGIIMILGVAIALALAMTIARAAVTSRIDAIKGSTGNSVSISPAGYFGFQGGGNPLTTSEMAKVAALPHVTFVRQSIEIRMDSTKTNLQSSINFGGLGGGFGGGGAGSVYGSPPVRFIGTNSPGTVLTGGANGGGTEKLVAGTSFSATSNANVAVLGAAIATKNSLHVGSTFVAWGKTITVIGIYDAQSTFANDGVLMPLATVQTLSSSPGDVTSATALIDSVDHVTAAVTAIKTSLGSAADVTDTATQAQAALAPLNSVKTVSSYSLVGAVGAAALILLLSMLMVVRERRREIGVLKAIGASSRSVITQFIAESSTFTLLGSIVGLAGGVVLANPITNVLVSSSSSQSSGGFSNLHGGFPGGMPTPPAGGGFGFRHGFGSAIAHVRTAIGWSTLLEAIVIAFVIAAIGSTVAAASVTRIRPAEVLRSE
jgi:putative ABC transport system permease protein